MRLVRDPASGRAQHATVMGRGGLPPALAAVLLVITNLLILISPTHPRLLPPATFVSPNLSRRTWRCKDRCLFSTTGPSLSFPPVPDTKILDQDAIGIVDDTIYGVEVGADGDGDDDDASAQSEFGTRGYWDATYNGLGDFPADEYSWYYGWDVVRRHWHDAVGHTGNSSTRVLVPGIGNDPILLDLHGAGWTDLTAFDYSPSAVERQVDILSSAGGAGGGPLGDVRLLVRDARSLDEEWGGEFDVVLEKGTLDAVYLSCAGDSDIETENLEAAVEELHRVLRGGGVFLSFSGVVPEGVRRRLFPESKWEWLRDGSNDLQAGCFIWKKR